MIDLSVCIVTYNARELLLACLESVYNSASEISMEVILVDNASTDGSRDAVRARFPHVRVIENAKNLGFVKPTNQAMMASRARHVLWLNNDTVVLDDALARRVGFMDAHPDVGVCGPKVMNRDGTIQNQCRRGFPTPVAALAYFSGLSRLFPKNPRFASYLMTHFDEDQTHEVDAVSGSCLLLRREVMDQIGLLDADIYAYGEDLDYCVRAQKAAWRIYYYPQSQGHPLRRTRREWCAPLSVNLPLLPLDVAPLPEAHRPRSLLSVQPAHWSRYCCQVPPDGGGQPIPAAEGGGIGQTLEAEPGPQTLGDCP